MRIGNTQSVSIPFLFLFFFTSHPYIQLKYLQYVTVSGKTTLLAEIEKVGFLLTMDSINTRLCCGTSS